MKNSEFVGKWDVLSTSIEAMRASGEPITKEALIEEMGRSIDANSRIQNKDAEKALWEEAIQSLSDDTFQTITQGQVVPALQQALRENNVDLYESMGMLNGMGINLSQLMVDQTAFEESMIYGMLPDDLAAKISAGFNAGEAEAFRELLGSVEQAKQTQVEAGNIPDTPEEERERSGGFMDRISAMLSGLGPIGALIGAVISFFTQMFTGGSQEPEAGTSVTPPPGQRAPGEPEVEVEPEVQPEQERTQEQEAEKPGVLSFFTETVPSLFGFGSKGDQPEADDPTVEPTTEPGLTTEQPPSEQETSSQQDMGDVLEDVVDFFNPFSSVTSAETTTEPTAEPETGDPTLPDTVTNNTGEVDEEVVNGELTTPQTGQNNDPSVPQERSP